MDPKMKVEIFRRIVSDVVIICSGGVVLLLFKTLGSPYSRGFFCDDESLMHPFHPSTVTSAMLYGIGFIVGVALIVTVEAVWIYGSQGNIQIQREDSSRYWRWRVLLQASYVSVIPFIFGAVVEHCITDIGKYSVGRLRPHFFSVCHPNMSTIDCSSGYVTEFHCTGIDYQLSQVRLSFPSGHASFSSYVAVYLMIYLQKRMRLVSLWLVRPLLQMAWFSLAWYTALSRISDYKHHPTDVFAGMIIGTVTAILVAYFVSDLFRSHDGEPTCGRQYSHMTNPAQNTGTESQSIISIM